MKLTVAEKKWFERLEKALSAAPASLKKKGRLQVISSYTIGDSDVTVYDEEKLIAWKEDNPDRAFRDAGPMIDEAEAGLYSLSFPFSVESTAG